MVTGNVYAADPDRFAPSLIDLVVRDKSHYATVNIAYLRKIIIELEGFNERPGNAEDLKLPWRIHRAG